MGFCFLVAKLHFLFEAAIIFLSLVVQNLNMVVLYLCMPVCKILTRGV